MFRSMVTASTALSDTTEKLIDTLTVPDEVSRLVGVSGHAMGGAGITTLENVTGKMRIRNKSRGEESEFLLDIVGVLTSGSPAYSPKVHPCDMQVSQGNQIEVYMTMDLAQTVANTGRACLVFE